MDRCKNKGFWPQEVCNNQPHPLSPFSIKAAWILTWVRWFFGTTAHHLLWLLAFQIQVIIPCPTRVTRFTGVSCGGQYELGLSSRTKFNWHSDWDYGVWGNGKVKVAQSCLTLCGPKDCYPPGSSVYGIFQAKILEWVAISISRGSSWLNDQTSISCVSRIGRKIPSH